MPFSSPILRPLKPTDAFAARALAEREFARVPQAEAARSAVESALGGASDEYRTVVAETDGEVIGVAVYGMIAGTRGTAKLHAILVTASARTRGIAGRLCDHVARELAREGARLIIAEVPDCGALRPGLQLLQRCGWHEEARVPDFFAAGEALLLFRRELTDEVR